MAHDGQHRASGVRRRRTITLVISVALLLLAFGGGYLLANSGKGDTQAVASHDPSTAPSHSRSPSAAPSKSESPTPTPSPSASPVLADGRSFVYAKKMGGTSSAPTFTFDLALFLTDQAAAEAAAAHGDVVTDGYYIVNDNPKLRTLPVSPAVTILYYPSSGSACCTYATGSLDGFTAAVNGIAMTDYPDMRYVPWWIAVQDGVIIKIKQQYLP